MKFIIAAGIFLVLNDGCIKWFYNRNSKNPTTYQFPKDCRYKNVNQSRNFYYSCTKIFIHDSFMGRLLCFSYVLIWPVTPIPLTHSNHHELLFTLLLPIISRFRCFPLIPYPLLHNEEHRGQWCTLGDKKNVNYHFNFLSEWSFYM